MTQVMTEGAWTEQTKNMLKAELRRRGVSYEQLAEKLSEMGIDDSARNIANKVSRGGFSAVFLVQCLHAIGCRNLAIELGN